MYLRQLLVHIFIGLFTCSLACAGQYYSTSDIWVTPIRLDPSGLAVIPDTETMLVINDQGYVEYEKNKPILQVLSHGNLMTYNAIIGHDSVEQMTGGKARGKKWDGEDIECIVLPDGAIGCALISGKRDQFLWIEAKNRKEATEGTFHLMRSFNFQTAIKSASPHPKDNPYELEGLSFVGIDAGNAQFVMTSRGPVDRFDGTGNYFVYRLDLDLAHKPDTLPEVNEQGYSLEQIGTLPNSVCPYDPELESSFINFMRISAMYKPVQSDNGFLVCAHEEDVDYSYFIPVTINAKGITVRKNISPIPVGFSDVQGFKPKVMKIEGFACVGNMPYVAIDADHRDAGVFMLSDRFAELCK